jgi:predicted Rossmann fold flavoprotein
MGALFAMSEPNAVIVVGAGAAGLMAAIFAAGRGADVTLIERTADGGRKILISGGGRCNVLPSVLAPERFVSESRPHLVRALLKAWPLHEQRAFFERDLGIPLALEAETGKLFPQSNRARDVRDGLVRFARERGVRIMFGTTLTDLAFAGDGWTVPTSRGELRAARVVLATGGLSVPATGSDGTGLRIASALGHREVATYPALTPLLADSPAGPPHASLSGVALAVRLRARIDGKAIETRGGFLFTHRGYSGPSVLDISHVATRAAGEHPPIRAQWSTLDAAAWTRELSGHGSLVSSILSRHIPTRLAERLMIESGMPLDRRVSDLRRGERTALVERLTSYELPWTGNEGYKKAEVTGTRWIPGRWKAGARRDSFCAARCSTPSARSAATTSPGPGPLAGPPDSGRERRGAS